MPLLRITIDETADLSFACAIEITNGRLIFVVGIANQRTVHVGTCAVVDNQVDMETRRDGFAGLAPFRYENAFGIMDVEPFAHFVPQAYGGRVVPVVVFH